MLVGGSHDLVEAVLAPEGQEVDHAAAGDVDRVLGEQVLGEVHRGDAKTEQRHVRGHCPAALHGAVEGADLLVGIAAGQWGGGRSAADCADLTMEST